MATKGEGSPSSSRIYDRSHVAGSIISRTTLAPRWFIRHGLSAIWPDKPHPSVYTNNQRRRVIYNRLFIRCFYVHHRKDREAADIPPSNETKHSLFLLFLLRNSPNQQLVVYYSAFAALRRPHKPWLIRRFFHSFHCLPFPACSPPNLWTDKTSTERQFHPLILFMVWFNNHFCRFWFF